MRLGTIIYNYRNEHNLSLGDFANMTNLSKTYVSMLEKGINTKTNKPLIPSIQTLDACAKAMNFSVDELVRLLDDDQLININDNVSLGDLRKIGKTTTITHPEWTTIYKDKSNKYHEDTYTKSPSPLRAEKIAAVPAVVGAAAGLGPLGLLMAAGTYFAVKSEMNKDKAEKIYDNQNKIFKTTLNDKESLLEILDTATIKIKQSKINDDNKNILLNHFEYTKSLVKSLFTK